MICALDLISGLVEGLGSGFESLFRDSNLGNLLLECMKVESNITRFATVSQLLIKDPQKDICQSSFALVGDLARNCILHLNPFLPSYLPILIDYVRPKNVDTSVCNNAVWAIGEIVLRAPADVVKPYLSMILEKLVLLISRRNSNRNIMENTAISLGKCFFPSCLQTKHLDLFFFVSQGD